MEAGRLQVEFTPRLAKPLIISQAVEELYATRPDLKARLVPLNTGNPAPANVASINTRVAKEKLGLKEFITWQKSLSDTVDSLLELEKKWKSSA